MTQQHPHGGQQGSTEHGETASDDTKARNGSMQPTGNGTEQRTNLDEKDEQQRGGDADNPSDPTGGSESGGEDKGAKQ